MSKRFYAEIQVQVPSHLVFEDEEQQAVTLFDSDDYEGIEEGEELQVVAFRNEPGLTVVVTFPCCCISDAGPTAVECANYALSARPSIAQYVINGGEPVAPHSLLVRELDGFTDFIAGGGKVDEVPA